MKTKELIILKVITNNKYSMIDNGKEINVLSLFDGIKFKFTF